MTDNSDTADTSTTPAPPAKPFGKAMAEAFRGIKKDYESKPADSVDPSVREQVNSDLDKIADTWDNKKPWPSTI
jgi:hypothetical protein